METGMFLEKWGSFKDFVSFFQKEQQHLFSNDNFIKDNGLNNTNNSINHVKPTRSVGDKGLETSNEIGAAYFTGEGYFLVRDHEKEKNLFLQLSEDLNHIGISVENSLFLEFYMFGLSFIDGNDLNMKKKSSVNENSIYLAVANQKDFLGIIKTSDGFYLSSLFSEIKRLNYSLNKYKSFNTFLKIDLKSYEQIGGERLIFSKFEKVDLLYMLNFNISLDHQSEINKKDLNSPGLSPGLKSKVVERTISNMLQKNIDWQKMVDQVNAKTAKVLEAKKAKG
jgi:hypothetical protein